MATIGEIANESKAILEDIRTNTLGTRDNTSQLITETQDLEGRVTHLDGTTAAGFVNLAGGIEVLIELQKQGNDLAATNNAQNDTMLCWLAKIAHVLCDMKHDLDASLVVQRHTDVTLSHLDSVVSLVHARETLEIQSRDHLQAEVDECCGEKPTPPGPCFEDCTPPEEKPYRPIDVSWKPIRPTETPKSSGRSKRG